MGPNALKMKAKNSKNPHNLSIVWEQKNGCGVQLDRSNGTMWYTWTGPVYHWNSSFLCFSFARCWENGHNFLLGCRNDLRFAATRR